MWVLEDTKQYYMGDTKQNITLVLEDTKQNITWEVQNKILHGRYKTEY